MTTVKLKIRPDQPLDFPGLCVHCGDRAAAWHTISRRQGRVSRHVEVPVCDRCQGVLRRNSYLEERWQRLGLLGLLSGTLLAGALAWFLLPAALPDLLREGVALGAALLTAFVVYQLARRARQRAALPDKQAIRDAARIRRFSWRTMTFDFANEAVGEQFAALHADRLMEI